MRRRASLAVLAAVLPAAILLQGCAPDRKAPERKAAAVDCLIDEGPCRGTVEDLQVTLEITPRPVRTMTDLVFRVEAVSRGGPLQEGEVGVDLTMPGMVMAQNRVILSRRESGAYEGSGVIVRCPGGGKGWRATVLSPSIPHIAFDFMVDLEK